MSLGTGALKVSGEGPEVIQAPRGGLHGNPPHLTFLGGCLRGVQYCTLSQRKLLENCAVDSGACPLTVA